MGIPLILRHLLLYYIYAKFGSSKKCRRKCRLNCPVAPVPKHKYEKSSRATGHIPDRKRTRRRHVMTKEKRDKTGVRLETYPRNRRFDKCSRRVLLYLQQAMQQKSCMSESPGSTAVIHEFTAQTVTTDGLCEPRLPGLWVVTAWRPTCHGSLFCMVTIVWGLTDITTFFFLFLHYLYSRSEVDL